MSLGGGRGTACIFDGYCDEPKYGVATLPGGSCREFPVGRAVWCLGSETMGAVSDAETP